MSEPRQMRDILAEALWREPGIAFMRKPWALWDEIAPGETERVRMRADHIMRLLADMGVELVQTGIPTPSAPPHQSPTIWRYTLADKNVERLVRRGPGDEWQIVTDGKVEQRFTLAEVHKYGGLVLTGAPEAREIPAFGRKISALAEIYRVGAEAMGPVEGGAA